jgi:hypothetical protein
MFKVIVAIAFSSALLAFQSEKSIAYAAEADQGSSAPEYLNPNPRAP